MSKVSVLLGGDFEYTPDMGSEPFYYPGEQEYREYELSKYTVEELEAELDRRVTGTTGVMVNTKEVLKQWEKSLV